MPRYDEGDYGYDVYGGDRDPIVTDHIIDYFPDIFQRKEADGSLSVLTRYVNAHEAEVRKFDAKLSYTILSRQVDHASGDDLDRIGAKFGELGKRRGRNDDEYRSYLKGIVQSFRGRGTKPGMKFAISSAVGTDTDNIVIDEDFQNNSYDVRITDTDVGFLSSVVNTVAELADPSGVELANPPIIQLEGADIRITATESSVIDSVSGLSSDSLYLDGSWTLD